MTIHILASSSSSPQQAAPERPPYAVRSEGRTLSHSIPFPSTPLLLRFPMKKKKNVYIFISASQSFFKTPRMKLSQFDSDGISND
jgi:hypothetical protein